MIHVFFKILNNTVAIMLYLLIYGTVVLNTDIVFFFTLMYNLLYQSCTIVSEYSIC